MFTCCRLPSSGQFFQRWRTLLLFSQCLKSPSAKKTSLPCTRPNSCALPLKDFWQLSTTLFILLCPFFRNLGGFDKVLVQSILWTIGVEINHSIGCERTGSMPGPPRLCLRLCRRVWKNPLGDRGGTVRMAMVDRPSMRDMQKSVLGRKDERRYGGPAFLLGLQQILQGKNRKISLLQLWGVPENGR